MMPTIREVIETALGEKFKITIDHTLGEHMYLNDDGNGIPGATQHILESLARWGYGVAPIDVILPPIEDQ